jgi:hypothetical protein
MYARVVCSPVNRSAQRFIKTMSELLLIFPETDTHFQVVSRRSTALVKSWAPRLPMMLISSNEEGKKGQKEKKRKQTKKKIAEEPFPSMVSWPSVTSRGVL